MKTAKLLPIVLGIVLMSGTFAHAAFVDVVQSPTDFFVPDQANVYNTPYYRWWDEDWGWTHGAYGGAFTTASLNISAWDVDAAQGEVDNIYAYDSGAWTLLGSLSGLNDDWGYSAFALGPNFFDDIATGLQVKIDIDSTHTSNTWAVTLAKSALSLDEGQLPPPNPGENGVIPEPATMALLGSGLLGFAGIRRKKLGVV